MGLTNTTVEIAFELTTGDQPVFRLNDPVRGVLDNVTYRLAGAYFIDITDQIAGVSIKRGKNRDLDRYSAGNANIVINNENRYFDPRYSGSPYIGNIVPRRPVRVLTNGIPQFTGYVDQWAFDYDIGGKSNATIVASDAFMLFAQQVTKAGSVPQELTGARINRVLNMSTIGWPTENRDIDAGENTVSSGTVVPSNALEYLQTVESSELGQLFMTKDNKIRFLENTNVPTEGSIKYFFADDGSGIPYTNAVVSYGTEMMLNQAEVAWTGGTAVAENVEAQLLYGISSESVDTFLASDAEALAVAQFLVYQHGQPEYRFEELTVSLNGNDGDTVEDLLDAEIGDVAQITFTPNGVGDPIVRLGLIISIAHQVDAVRHDVTYGFASLDEFSVFVLDDATFGILDEDSLGV